MIVIIIGSMREGSQSEKVGHYIAGQLENTEIINLREVNLPFWTEKNPSFHSNVSKILHKAKAFILITPEWDGMASPAIKNFFNYCRNQELAHKPALLVAVSSGQGGSYPIAELRMSGYKNAKICYLPEHVIVRHVDEVLNDDVPGSEKDRLIRERIRFGLNVLNTYKESFDVIRAHTFLFNNDFQNGM